MAKKAQKYLQSMLEQEIRNEENLGIGRPEDVIERIVHGREQSRAYERLHPRAQPGRLKPDNAARKAYYKMRYLDPDYKKWHRESTKKYLAARMQDPEYAKQFRAKRNARERALRREKKALALAAAK